MRSQAELGAASTGRFAHGALQLQAEAQQWAMDSRARRPSNPAGPARCHISSAPAPAPAHAALPLRSLRLYLHDRRWRPRSATLRSPPRTRVRSRRAPALLPVRRGPGYCATHPTGAGDPAPRDAALRSPPRTRTHPRFASRIFVGGVDVLQVTARPRSRRPPPWVGAAA